MIFGRRKSFSISMVAGLFLLASVLGLFGGISQNSITSSAFGWAAAALDGRVESRVFNRTCPFGKVYAWGNQQLGQGRGTRHSQSLDFHRLSGNNSAVGKRAKFAMVIFITALVGAAVWSALSGHEPVYQGKSLQAWMRDFDDPYTLVWAGKESEKHLRAAEAIRHIGTNAAPFLVKMAGAKDGPFERVISTVANCEGGAGGELQRPERRERGKASFRDGWLLEKGNSLAAAFASAFEDRRMPSVPGELRRRIGPAGFWP
jgi:hypothetical protein